MEEYLTKQNKHKNGNKNKNRNKKTSELETQIHSKGRPNHFTN